MLASLLFSGGNWVLPAIVLLALALIILAWTYGKTPGNPGLRWTCVTLKTLGFLILGLCLLEPLWSDTRPRPGSNLFLLLADNSQGMMIKDANEPGHRGEILRALLTDETAPWREKLGANFQVRNYFFDSRLNGAKDFQELSFDGRASSLAYSLKTLAERYEGQPVAGVLLLSDGNATDMPDGVLNAEGLPPVYPVAIGKDDPLRDIALGKIAASQTAFEDAPVTLQVDVTSHGYIGEDLEVQLFEVRAFQETPDAAVKSEAQTANPGERLLDQQTQKVVKDGEPLAFRFMTRPDKSGLVFYRVRVANKQTLDLLPGEKQAEEATPANNSRMVVVDRGQGPYRILYVGGRPNWEFKFLSRALSEDDQVELIGLIRIARREPKFEFKGRSGESSNPLFRGFDQKGEETERYDQPVLIRLNTKDDMELRGGFPKTAEDLFGYHAVVIDDVEAGFFTREQLSLLQKFVSERGGGFIMFGGLDTFQEGKYDRTPVGDMLPVYLNRNPGETPIENLRLQLSREGWLQPWARLRSNEIEERTRLEKMPEFQIMNEVRGIKPGASVIAAVSDHQGAQYPALVVQRFGRGRSAALMVGDFWRWGMHDEAEQTDLSKAWRQMMRWLVSDVPNRLEFLTQQNPADPDGTIQMQVRVRDKQFLPFDNALVKVTVFPVGTASANAASATNGVPMIAEPALNEAGLYETGFIPRESGGYRALTVVTDENGLEIGREEAGWTAEPAAEEFRSLKPNRSLLASIASKTGGEMVESHALEAFVDSLPNRKAPITEHWTFPLWDHPSVFLLALACFVTEWGLRRWKGLP